MMIHVQPKQMFWIEGVSVEILKINGDVPTFLDGLAIRFGTNRSVFE